MVVTTSHWFVKESHKQRIFTLLFYTFFSIVFLFRDLSIECGYFCSLLFESRVVWNECRITLVFFDCGTSIWADFLHLILPRQFSCCHLSFTLSALWISSWVFCRKWVFCKLLIPPPSLPYFCTISKIFPGLCALTHNGCRILWKIALLPLFSEEKG